ncbi:CAP domain-containing protein [Streptomyces sp. NPDC016309]|uniref:CAP domain-containing protein n=1 Tax=Streptomyces sp. NPDC016309 TaxID=3364965 RepID=UPI0036F9BFEF
MRGVGQVVRLVNIERRKAGCPPLKVHRKLARAARGHSVDMAGRNRLSHRGSGGSTLVGRINRTGHAWGMAGENVARGYPDAAAVLRGWMDSPGHRANIGVRRS